MFHVFCQFSLESSLCIGAPLQNLRVLKSVLLVNEESIGSRGSCFIIMIFSMFNLHGLVLDDMHVIYFLLCMH